MEKEKSKQSFYMTVILLGILATNIINGGSLKEILLNSLLSLVAFALIGMIVDNFWPEDK